MASPNIEVANDFFHDCLDFLHRYRLTGDAFYAIKSKRLKLFLDLRMAAECVLYGECRRKYTKTCPLRRANPGFQFKFG